MVNLKARRLVDSQCVCVWGGGGGEGGVISFNFSSFVPALFFKKKSFIISICVICEYVYFVWLFV